MIRIEADDWMCFRSLRLDLTDARSVAITGKNDHGKSALLDALTFCLYGEIAGRTKAVNGRSPDKFIRHGTDGFALRVWLYDEEGHETLVTREKRRGQTAALNLYVDGELKSGSIVETQARIDDQIGLNFAAMTASVIMIQHDSAGVMNEDPRYRKDLLITYLRLGIFEGLHKQAKAEADEAAADLKLAMAEVTRLEAALVDAEAVRATAATAAETLAAARAALADAEERRSVLRERYAEAKFTRDRLQADADAAAATAAERDTLANSLLGLRQRLDEAIAEAAEPEPVVQLPEPAPDGEIDEQERIRDAALATVMDARRIRGEVAHLEERLAEAVERRGMLAMVPCGGEGIYATCPLLADVPTEDQIAFTAASLDRTAASLTIADGQQAVADAAEAERKRLLGVDTFYVRAKNGATTVRRDWQARVTSAGRLVVSRRETLEAAGTRLAALQGAPAAQVATDALDAAKAAVGALLAEGEIVKAEVETTKAAADAAETVARGIDRSMGMIEDAERRLGGWREQADEARQRGEVWAGLVGAWHRDGVPTEMIEQAIPLIEAKANDILSRLPEELTMTIRTQRPTKGGMAETLDVITTLAGVEREYGLLSWGARLRIDVALRLALGEIVSHRSGQRIRWLWWDEPLADLDPEGEEALLEMLNAIRDDYGLIVIVSHSPTFSDALETRGEVVKEDEVADVRMAA